MTSLFKKTQTGKYDYPKSLLFMSQLNHGPLSLRRWLQTTCSLPVFELQPLANDASFRRYFRVQLPNARYVVMISPPEAENLETFIVLARYFKQHGFEVPEIIAYDLNQGFILLSDLGDALYLKLFATHSAETLYTQALNVLSRWQHCQPLLPNHQPLKPFDETLLRFEFNLFVDWFLKKHLGSILTASQEQALERIFSLLIVSALEQPQVCVHRDYHSRNLLLVNKQTVGILDFQDAVYGPITYDAVSLLKDAYIDWPEEQVEKWLSDFYFMLTPSPTTSLAQFTQWFDWMGLQRHLKILGIFARLCYRDQKPDYLNSLDRLLTYIYSMCERYPTFALLKTLLPLDLTSSSFTEIEKK
jgi:N-acetylmuramate 1-kinase